MSAEDRRARKEARRNAQREYVEQMQQRKQNRSDARKGKKANKGGLNNINTDEDQIVFTDAIVVGSPTCMMIAGEPVIYATLCEPTAPRVPVVTGTVRS
jgi:hypothetical protein